MKKLLITSIILFAGLSAKAQNFNSNSTWTNGYYKPSTGQYVDGYQRTTPNSTNYDNYSTYGNTNPYTGSQGSKARDYSNEAYNYGQGKQIYEGERGGQYYINGNGNKTYVPKRSW